MSLVALHIIKTVTGENVKNAGKIPPSARRLSNAKSSSAEPDSTDSEDEHPIDNYEPSLVKEISKGVISYFHGDDKSDKNEARNEDQEANDNASLSSISEVDEPSQATGHLPPTVGQQVQSGSESESSAIKSKSEIIIESPILFFSATSRITCKRGAPDEPRFG